MISYGALAFIRDDDGFVRAGVPIEAETAEQAVRQAEALGMACGGAIAYSTMAYDMEPTILASFGSIPPPRSPAQLALAA